MAYTRRPSSPSPFSNSVNLNLPLDFNHALECYWNWDKYDSLANHTSWLFHINNCLGIQFLRIWWWFSFSYIQAIWKSIRLSMSFLMLFSPFYCFFRARGKSLLRNLWKSLLEIRNLVRLIQKSLWKMRNLVRLLLKWFTPRFRVEWPPIPMYDYIEQDEQLLIETTVESEGEKYLIIFFFIIIFHLFCWLFEWRMWLSGGILFLALLSVPSHRWKNTTELLYFGCWRTLVVGFHYVGCSG